VNSTRTVSRVLCTKQQKLSDFGDTAFVCEKRPLRQEVS